MTDPFGTEAIRRRVVDAWAASVARFREDANAEEDLVSGAYRDRLIIELAQNAADAAVRAGQPGMLSLSLVDGELRAANTGAPLDADGVEALATLRASAKRDATTVGRFGVGFAAVLAVSDAPSIISTTGGVRFSRAESARVAAGIPALGEELHRREGVVPVLRLPWPTGSPTPPNGFTTEVRLPLRPGAEAAVVRALAELDATLLLALPALDQIEVTGLAGGPVTLSRRDSPDGTVVLRDRGTDTRWLVRSATGTLPADLLAGRPVEERIRSDWRVTWAIPVGDDGGPDPLREPQVLHAPTPSDEPVSLPARLVATLPLGPDRRHVAPGPVTDLLVRRAAAAYAELVAALPPVPAVLALVPRPGLAPGELAAGLAGEALAALREAAWLPAAAGPDAASRGDAASGADAAGGADRLRPPGATVLDAAGEALVDALVDVVPGLLPAAWSARSFAAPLAALGVRRLSTADIVDMVSGIDRPPSWWRRLYAGLADAPDREALAALPVPLADGRTVVGAGGLLLPEAGLPATAAAALGLRIAHPDGVHPLLERLGASRATPRGVLAEPRVRAAVATSYDEDDPAPIAEAVLELVVAADLRPGELPWLAELALPGADGDWYPAGELLFPRSPLADVMAPDAPFGTAAADLVERWGPDVLRAVGVPTTFSVLTASEAEIDPDGDGNDLDRDEEWAEAVLDRLPPQPVPPRLVELVAARDLELVRPDRWDQALALLAQIPELRAPAVAMLADGTHRQVPSYTSWWLATHPVLRGSRPDQVRLPDAVELSGLYDEAPTHLPVNIVQFAGALAGVIDVLADPDRATDLLYRLGDPARTVLASTLSQIYRQLAEALDGYTVDPPDRVRVAPDRVADAGVAVLLDLPYLLPLLGERVPVPSGGMPGPVADLLGLPFASEVVPPARVVSTPERTSRWADLPGAALAAERAGADAPPEVEVAVHNGLWVDSGTSAVPVSWWPDGSTDHVDAAAGASALGRALAWRLEQWERRAALTEALARPADEERLRAEDAAG